MALTTAELTRLKYELGFNTLSAGAEPYIDIAALFESVISPNLLAGASTTSSTAVTAATAPTPVTLTLDDASSVSAFDTLIVDVDSREEHATVQSVTGSDVTVLLQKAHSGTYPVLVEGGESMVRQLLRQLRTVAAEQASSGLSAAGLRQVDEIKFANGSSSGNARFDALMAERMRLRDELASMLGIQNLWRQRPSASTSVVLV